MSLGPEKFSLELQVAGEAAERPARGDNPMAGGGLVAALAQDTTHRAVGAR